MPSKTEGGSFLAGITQIIRKGLLSSSPSAGLGYSTGAGGIITQASSKSTGVTLHKIAGQITMNNAALNAGVEVSFTVTNNVVQSTDCILVNWSSVGTASAYMATANTIANGSFVITVTNLSGSNLSEAIVLSYLVLRSARA